MSNIDYGINTIITKRRHPNKIIICAKITYKVFGDLPIKELPRPAFIYYYNININRVNKEDQIRAFYLI